MSRECVLKLNQNLANSESPLWLSALIIYKVVLVVHGRSTCNASAVVITLTLVFCYEAA